MATKHFGILLRKPMQDLRLRRDNYICKNKDGEYYFKDSWLKNNPERWPEHEKLCIQNFDLNMGFFSDLSRTQFEKAINALRTRYQLKEIFDLNDVEKRKGIYVMVLDEYCQIYAGKTSSVQGIKHRITTHWNKPMHFDRLLLGSPRSSPISIDSFRALDTTRIFIKLMDTEIEMDKTERNIIADTPSEFCSNRTAGGSLKGGLLEACAKAKFRTLI